MKKRLLSGIISCMMGIMLVSGCASGNNPGTGNEGTTENSATESSAEAGNQEEDKEDKKEEATPEAGDSSGTTESGGAVAADKDISGNWVIVSTNYHSEYNSGEEYDYTTLAQDEESLDSYLNIEERDGSLFADYKYNYYESSLRVFGEELVLQNETAYEDCPNKDWCYTFSHAEKDDGLQKKITKIDDDYLVVASEYVYEDADYGYKSVDTDFYVKEDSEILKNQEELRYKDTVTVSSAEQLLRSIKDNTKIILEEGDYDISNIPRNSIDNGHVLSNGYDYTISNVSNLRLEAKEGADVRICIDEAYSPVLNFDGCSHVYLDGLTVGHEVEPGYCSGSVLYFSSSNGIQIDNCKLYGSGTYGIEASGVYDVSVNNTEIYECTYGILDFYNVGNFYFKDCKFRDCSDMSLICVSSGYSIVFENCEFYDNEVAYSENYFVSMQQEYDDVTFKGCTFRDNKYFKFSNKDVTMENCNVEDRDQVNGDTITMSDLNTSVDILDLYDKAVAKQLEIDDKFAGDESLDQQSLNSLAYEEFYLWDSFINKIWSYLGNTLPEDQMSALSEEQLKWISDKEEAVKEAGAAFEGGSMQPMIENGVAAEWTRKRVEYLIDKFIREN